MEQNMPNDEVNDMAGIIRFFRRACQNLTNELTAMADLFNNRVDALGQRIDTLERRITRMLADAELAARAEQAAAAAKDA